MTFAPRPGVDKGTRVVTVAICGNFLLAVSKFVAAIITGSSVMVSEGIHSLVDTGDGLLLLLGRHRSRKPPDDEHPFGHGQELYFWALIVAMVVFGAGGGVSAYEGVSHIIRPHPLESPGISYAVLGLATVFEGVPWFVAFRAVLRERVNRTVKETLDASKDPTEFTILLEDSAALAGVLVAFLGIWLSDRFGWTFADGVASIVVGLILATVAIVLASKVRGLLVGEAADRQTIDDVRRLATADPAVERIRPPLTMHFGPEQVLLNLDIQFKPGLSTSQIANAVDRLERAIRDRHPEVSRIFLEVEWITRGEGDPAPAD